MKRESCDGLRGAEGGEAVVGCAEGCAPPLKKAAVEPGLCAPAACDGGVRASGSLSGAEDLRSW